MSQAERITQERIRLFDALCRELGLEDRKDRGKKIEKLFEDISAELGKTDSDDEQMGSQSPIDDVAGKVKKFIRDIAEDNIDTKKAEKSIDGLFGVFKKAIKNAVSTPKTSKNAPNPLNHVIGKVKDALEVAVTDVPKLHKKEGIGDRFARKYPKILNAYVSEPHRKKAIYILKRMTEFGILRGGYRPTMRDPHARTLPGSELRRILDSYFDLKFFGDDIVTYLTEFDRDPGSELRSRLSNFPLKAEAELIAAEIDAGNQELLGLISGMLSDGALEYDEDRGEDTIHAGIVRGIVMSQNKELLGGLIQMLLNAGLEEGVRQCICENMDYGTLEAQTEIFKAICEHDLIRFSSVRRALTTQTGLHTSCETFMRVSDRAFELMKTVIYDESQCEVLIQSHDYLQIAMGIWGMGIRDRQKVLETMECFLREGSREQIIALSHNDVLYMPDEGTRMHYAKYVLDHYADDACVMAAWIRLFICKCNDLYLNAFREWDDSGLHGYGLKFIISGKYKADPIPLAPYFESELEARDYYDKLKALLATIPAGDYHFEDVMPWDVISLTKVDVLLRMFLIAWMLQDTALLTELAPRYAEMEGKSEECLVMSTWNAVTREQRNVLFDAAIRGNDEDSRAAEFIIEDRISFNVEDYRVLRDYFRLKSMRQGDYLYNIFMKAPYVVQLETVEYLLKSKKDLRVAGLELVHRLKNDETQQSTFEKARCFVEQLKKVTASEQIIVNRILEKSDALKEASASLYVPNTVAELPIFDADRNYYLNLLNRWLPEYIKIIGKLNDLIHEHKDYSFTTVSDEETTIGDNILHKISLDPQLEEIDHYPLADLWKKFYKEEIRSFEALMIFTLLAEGDVDWNKFMMNLYGIDLSQSEGVNIKKWSKIKYAWHIYDILTSLYSWQVPKHVPVLSETVRSLAVNFMEKPVDQTYCIKTDYLGREYVDQSVFTSAFRWILNNYRFWGSRTEFKTYYIIYETLNRFYGGNPAKVAALDHIRAYAEKLISKDAVYTALFNMPLDEVFLNINPYVLDNESARRGEWRRFCTDEYATIKEEPLYAVTQELYWPMMDVILDTELRRGEQDTEYSNAIRCVPVIRGVRRLVEILVALGRDSLTREVYYGRGWSKQDNLSMLLFVSKPAPGEDENTLRTCLKGQKISENRLVDVAMFNDRWAPLIEKYLDWNGLVSGVCFFFAHVGEAYGHSYLARMERRKAMIARYTPIHFEDFASGAIDIAWFWETYNQLGEARFQKLYQSAKYISGDNIHTRARKYTDALLGKLNLEDTEELLMAKRNKDLLMAYPLIPLNGGEDLLRRYQFIQAFKKSSQNCGPQRRASEVAVIDMAIRNLAVHAGFEDVNRFILYIEAKLTDSHASAFEWTAVDDHVDIRLALTDENSSLALECRKDGKNLKNVPAKLSKHATVQEMRSILSQLKDQLSRSRLMFEEFMENGTELGLEELQLLIQNRLVGPMITKLVFMLGERSVYYGESGFENPQGIKFNLSPDAKLRIAHPYDLYKNGDWAYYQKYIFDHQIKQPFKQVFRELYVMTEEEREQEHSIRFSGNQIKPQRAVGCLKKRLWVTSYEDGLQKVYYKENVIAQIYAMADWFSPSDVEYPTLEYVCFYDRKMYLPLKIKEVPPIIFSEVMRDVDLVVSIAHAGDVDPETSHSTIEMRKIIAEYNVQLFGLNNVTFTDYHAKIEGKRASYTIHLGTGVVFQEGGAHIAVLPVHSQHRGKLFLPFVDEDPKTAEVITKILFFANDMKIKDPYIVQQIHASHDEAEEI